MRPPRTQPAAGVITLRVSLSLLLIAVALLSCRDVAAVAPLDPAQVVASPTRLVLPSAYLGQRTSSVVELVNRGGATATAEVSVSAPFEVDVAQLVLVRGGAATVTVSLTPSAPGHLEGVLLVGALAVPVESEGLPIPACSAPSACVAATFDLDAGVCLPAPLADGVACETRCVLGACRAAVCLGQLKGCDDGDACTVDACDEVVGCSHPPVDCPVATAPCQVPVCDPASGCAIQPAPEGTLCGPDDCAAAAVSVCIAGQCVSRPRPGTGQCANRWVPTTQPTRARLAMVSDDARKRVVAFGGQSGAGSLAETWEWDGARWQQRFPATSPPALWNHAMAWDARRQRVVLFGGVSSVGSASATLGETWEWDGSTWVQRSSGVGPTPRAGHAMAYDAARRRVVLFGGREASSALLHDTWEWDGLRWALQPVSAAPPARELAAMAYDEARQQVVLFGGRDDHGALRGDTWAWNGAGWSEVVTASGPSARIDLGLAWDAARRQLVLFGGNTTTGLVADTWVFDGVSWARRQPATSPVVRAGVGLAFDSARGQVLLFGGYGGALLGDTWGWSGLDWAEVGPVAPPPRTEHAVVWDGAGQQVLLFGGRSAFTGGALADTWAWDGAGWRLVHPPVSPPARYAPLLSYDEGRRRVVLFGGFDHANAPLTDTWEWDGVAWSSPPVPPPTVGFARALAYHPGNAATVLVASPADAGTSMATETWLWDGGAWAPGPPAPSLSVGGGLSACLGPQAEVLLLVSGVGSYALVRQWGWSGLGWTPFTGPLPFERTSVGLAYDLDRQRVVLTGGGGVLISQFSADTWEWDGSAWWQRQPLTSPPAGYQGHAGHMAYDAARKRMTLYDGADTWRLLP